MSNLKAWAEKEQAQYFANVALYFIGAFGAQRIDCKEAAVKTGMKYAQYNNATQVVYLEKGKRKAMQRMLDYKPYLAIADIKDAIPTDSGLVAHAGGRITQYASFDPRYAIDWHEQSKDVPFLLKITE